MDLISLVEKHGTTDPFKIIRNMGIGISFKPYTNTSGYHLSAEDFQHIVINSNLDNNMKRVVAAHELGHALLHKNISFACSPSDTSNWSDNELVQQLEKEANFFSVCLLQFNNTMSYLSSGDFSRPPQRGFFLFFFLSDDLDDEYIA